MSHPIQYDEPGSTKTGPKRLLVEKIDQTKALRLLAPGRVVYAVQFPDGTVKIGCSANLAQRIRRFRGEGGEVLGFMPGTEADEKRIHEALRTHRTPRGWEYYWPAPEVIAVVNEMRNHFNLPHVA